MTFHNLKKFMDLVGLYDGALSGLLIVVIVFLQILVFLQQCRVSDDFKEIAYAVKICSTASEFEK